MFLLKKIVAPLFFPIPLCIEVLLLGLFLLWFTRKQKTGKIVVSMGVVLLATLSYDAVSDALLKPLEYQHPPLMKLEDVRDVKWVVVLGGGHTSDPKVSVTSQLSRSSMVRLVEGIRLHKLLPENRLVLSGGSAFDPVPNAEVLSGLALAIGVDQQDVILESVSKDTRDEARLVKGIVGNDRFILVTSASHMPRSMALFQKLGMKPIPAPTDHSVKERQGMGPWMFFPNAGGLTKAERAFYEYLGLVWAKLRGQI
ncbi:MAG: envelope biogenesis factor ElyC [Desulfobacterales bacterium]|nr:envelope biogenesis factor ElyC [Desulfobacterales bacterium]